ncbi:MAG: YidC/Oxa1 family membrane protein insertase [Clostridia bacterium]|nr:YidC/Oxa1 family membrane protein insertase [Clostridia bacterium]
MSFLYSFFGFLLSTIYHWVGNYGVALILLTLFARILMLPMSVKQQKSTAKMQRLQSKVRKIQQQYAGDQRKIQEETQALYSREGTNPMSMGCLPLVLQLPVIYGLIGAIYHPLQYVLHIDAAHIEALTKALGDVIEVTTKNSRVVELQIIEHIGQLSGVVPAEVFEKISSFDFKFLGISLGQVPSIKHPDILWLVPILSFASQMASSLVMYVRQREQNPEMSKNPSMGCMTFGMPLFSLYFTFQFPVGIGIYWITSSVIAFVQMLVLNSIYSPKKMTVKLMVEETIQRRSREENLKRIAENKQSNE